MRAFRPLVSRGLAMLGGFMVGSCAATYSSSSSPFPEGPYVAAVTHWQSGEQRVYRSLHIVDPEAGVDFASAEHDEPAWRQVCDAPICAESIDLLNGANNPARENRNLAPSLASYPESQCASRTKWTVH